MNDALTIFIDGACRGNPGPAGIGVIIKNDKKVLKEISQSIGDATNNIAEYTALKVALSEAGLLTKGVLKIFTDSELLAKQITGAYKIKNENLAVLYQEVAQLSLQFKSVEITHVKRERNKEADLLATQAITLKQGKTIASTFKYVKEESPSSKG